MGALSKYIWYEKYRPTTLEEMTLDDKTRHILSSFLSSGEFPHLLLYGSPGSGKTTLAKILTTLLPCDVLTLNASGNDRSIETMKNAVASFAKSVPSQGRMKVVFLDEADGITREAQGSLRNTIEAYSDTCRFILTANNVGKIIDPLLSRCFHIYMSQYSLDNAVELLKYINAAENKNFPDEFFHFLASTFYPDLRSMVNAFQQASLSDSSTFLGFTNDNVIVAVATAIKFGDIGDIRKHIVGMTGFMSFYTHIFDNIGNLFPGALQAEAATILCEHLFYDTTVPDREINFVTMCARLAQLLGAPVNFGGSHE